MDDVLDLETDSAFNDAKEMVEDWVRTLHDAEPVACWRAGDPEELDINFAGDIEVRVHRIGANYLVVTNDPTDQYQIDEYSSFEDVSDHLARESKRGNPEDGWEFGLAEFNRLKDRYEELPSEVKEMASPEDILVILTWGDDEVSEWLFGW